MILSIMFSSMSSSLRTDPSLVNALDAGIKSVMQCGGATKGDRTMLDALIPACEAGVANAGTSAADVAKAMAQAAKEGAEATAQMKKAQAGRAAYVGETDLVGNVDPGSMAIALAFEAIEKAF